MGGPLSPQSEESSVHQQQSWERGLCGLHGAGHPQGPTLQHVPRRVEVTAPLLAQEEQKACLSPAG